MSLLKTSALNGIAVIVRTGTSLVLNKVLAIYVGPAGYALIGQFQNALTMVITFATGATGNGVVKLTAEYTTDVERQRRMWRTAGLLVFVTSLVGAVLILVFRDTLASTFLHNVEYSGVFVWLAICLPLIASNALLLAIMNGKKEIRRFVVSNIGGSIVSLLVTGTLAWQFGLYGALVALSVNQGILLLVTLQQALGTDWFDRHSLVGSIDSKEARRLASFVVMAATTAVVSPLSQILVRSTLVDRFGLIYAGYWDAMWRISALYLTLITTTLSLYYLPRIAEIRQWPEMRRELLLVYRTVLPLVIVASIVIFLARDLIISLLFASDFRPMRVLFAWQMAGDVVKIGSWLLAFLMIGRGLVKSFITTEIIAGLMFWLATIVCTQLFGFKGVAIAHLVTYSTYAVVVAALTISTPGRRMAMFSPDTQDSA